jgi:hypothetical protein
VDEFVGGLVEAGFIEVEVAAKDANDDLSPILPDKLLFSALITARKP